MKLIELDLGDRDWRKIRPQLIKDAYYIIRTLTRHWGIGYNASKIHPAGWIEYHHKDASPEKLNEILDMPHSWEYSLGTHESALQGSGSTYFLGDDIIGIYQIDDPEYFAYIAKKLLTPEENEDEEDEDDYDEDDYDEDDYDEDSK